LPGLFHHPIGRRRFLQTTALGGACLAFNGCRTIGGLAAVRRDFHLALLSDTHIPADPANRHRGHVKAIFHGHSHVWRLGRRQEVDVINLPALGFNFRDEDPVGWVEAWFRREGVQLALHALGGNRAEDGRRVSLAWE
jgi:hypothetical protein